MATKKTRTRTTEPTPDQQPASEAPAKGGTKQPRATRRTGASSAAEAEEKLGARESRDHALGAKQGATKGARRRKKGKRPAALRTPRSPGRRLGAPLGA